MRRRDPAREARLDPEHRALIEEWVRARRAVAQAQGWDIPGTVRWNVLYETLESRDPEAIDEAVAYIQERTAELETDLPEAKRRGKEARATEAWEAQALEVETWMAPEEIDRIYSGQPVWLYHGTSTALWPEIQEHGLLADAPHRFEESTSGVVFLTANSHHAYDFYARRAAGRHGGEPLLLRVIVPWDELEWDEDDEDIPSGRVQFMLRRDVEPWEIKEAGEERLE